MTEQKPEHTNANRHTQNVGMVLRGIEAGHIELDEAYRFASRMAIQRALELSEKNDALQQLSLRDKDTGLLNKYGVTQELEQILELPRHQRDSKIVLFIDLDGFKDINDKQGHQKGDDVIKAVGKKLGETVRKDDVLGRFGGDEFVMVVDADAQESDRRSDKRPDNTSRRNKHNTREEKVVGAIEHVRSEIEEAGRESGVLLSASIGIVDVNGHSTVAEILDEADKAMYIDKQDKFNRLMELRNQNKKITQQENLTTTDLEQPANPREIAELHELYKNLDVHAILENPPEGTRVKQLKFGQEDGETIPWKVLDVEHEDLENVLHNIGLILLDSEDLKAEALRRRVISKNVLDSILTDKYPAIAERIKILTVERLQIDEGLRSGSVDALARDEWQRKNAPERELLTSYTFWLLSKNGTDVEQLRA